MRSIVTSAFLILAGSLGAHAATTLDDLGRSVPVPPRVQRIVTLAPNITEILFAIGAGPRVAATDDFSDTPPAARRLPKVGGVEPSVERIVAARPDLVIALASSNHPQLASALAGARIPLYIVRSDRLDDVPRIMERLGELLQLSAAKSAASRLRAAVNAQHRTRAHSPRVLFLIWTQPLYVAGTETFADDLFRLTGARNSVEVRGWPQYALEAVAASPPDIILYPNHSLQAQQVQALLESAPTLGKCRVLAVDENLLTRPGPGVAEAAVQLNRIFDSWPERR